MRHIVFLGAALATIALVPAAEAAPHTGTLSTVATFNPAAFELPESVTVDDDGTFYLSMADTVRRLVPGGELEVLAALPVPPGTFADGVKVAPNGDVYTVTGNFASDPPGAFVFRIEQDGTVHQVAALDPEGFLDDLTIDEDGNLYVTDAFLGQVWKIDPQGNAAVWLSSPLFLGDPAHPAVVIHDFGSCGVTLDKHQENLYVSNLDQGMIVRVPIGEDGEAGAPEVFASGPLLVGAEGLAFDKKGTLFVGVQTQDRVAAVAPDGTVSVVAQGGVLDAPASIVFGSQPHDRKTLYIANFAINRALGTQPGIPHPSLVALPLDTRGLPPF